MAVIAAALIAWLAGLLPQAPSSTDVTITLERTICFGTCPAYTVTITGDGRVEYEGKEFVQVKGRASATIRPQDVAALVEAFEKARYFELQDKYTANITDMPTTITSIRLDGRYKRIVDYYNAPPGLKELERLIDRVAGTEKWVGSF